MPPTTKNDRQNISTHITHKEGFSDLLLYAMPRFSDVLRRLTDIKTGSANGLKMSPAVGLWLTLALVGVVISANSYSVGFQAWQPDAQGTITSIIPLGREDVIFRPMAIVPPLLLWLSHIVNFCSGVVGWVLPPLQSPDWNPATRPTVWSDATLALAWWFGGFVSVLVSSTQGLFTRTVDLGKQRQYAERLNKINKMKLKLKRDRTRTPRCALCKQLGAVGGLSDGYSRSAGWGWELFVATAL